MVVSLATVVESLNRHRLLAIVVIIFGLVASVGIAFLMRPVFRAEVVLLPATDESGMGDLAALAGQYGALAALAGAPLGNRGARDQAIGVLRSRVLVEKLINDRKLLPILFSKKWDASAGSWRSNAGDAPTLGDALVLFDRHIRQVREDIKSGLVTLRIDWFDRQLVAEWANGLVELANEELRTRAIAEANSALVVLEREMARAEAVELRSAISRLIEVQLKARMIASVRKEYAFKIIDPARVPDADKRVRPSRTLIVLLGVIASMLIATLIALWLDRVLGQESSTRRTAS